MSSSDTGAGKPQTVILRVEFQGAIAAEINAMPQTSRPTSAVLALLRQCLDALHLPHAIDEEHVSKPSTVDGALDMFWYGTASEHAAPGSMMRIILMKLRVEENQPEALQQQSVTRITFYITDGRMTVIPQDLTAKWHIVRTQTEFTPVSLPKLSSESTGVASAPGSRTGVTSPAAISAVVPSFTSAGRANASMAQSQLGNSSSSWKHPPTVSSIYRPPAQPASSTNSRRPSTRTSDTAATTASPQVTHEALNEKAAGGTRPEVEVIERRAEILALRQQLAAAQAQIRQNAGEAERRHARTQAEYEEHIRYFKESEQAATQRVLALRNRMANDGTGTAETVQVQVGQGGVAALTALPALDQQIQAQHAALQDALSARREAEAELQEQRDIIHDMVNATETTQTRDTLNMAAAVERLLARMATPESAIDDDAPPEHDPNIIAALSSVETYIRDLQNKLHGSQQACDRFQRMVSNLSNEREQNYRRVRDIERKMQGMEEQVVAAHEQTATSSRALVEHQSRVTELEGEQGTAVRNILALRDQLKAADPDADAQGDASSEQAADIRTALSSLETHVHNLRARLEDAVSARRTAELSFQIHDEVMRQMLDAAETKEAEEAEMTQVRDAEKAHHNRALLQRISALQEETRQEVEDAHDPDMTVAMSSLEQYVQQLRTTVQGRLETAETKVAHDAETMRAATQRLLVLQEPGVSTVNQETTLEAVLSTLEEHVQSLRIMLQDTRSAVQAAEAKVQEEQCTLRDVTTQLAEAEAATAREKLALRMTEALLRGQITELEQAQQEAIHRMVQLRQPGGIPGGGGSGVADTSLLAAMTTLEGHVLNLRANLNRRELELRDEQTRHERIMQEIEKECREPFVVPALLQAFVSMSGMTDNIMV